MSAPAQAGAIQPVAPVTSRPPTLGYTQRPSGGAPGGDRGHHLPFLFLRVKALTAKSAKAPFWRFCQWLRQSFIFGLG